MQPIDSSLTIPAAVLPLKWCTKRGSLDSQPGRNLKGSSKFSQGGLWPLARSRSRLQTPPLVVQAPLKRLNLLTMIYLQRASVWRMQLLPIVNAVRMEKACRIR